MAIQAAGFIGLGNIGKPMAKSLLDGDFDTYVYDVMPAPQEELAGAGAKLVTPGEMASICDVIGVCVRDDNDVRHVFLGENGILVNPKDGLVVAIHSTVKPETILEMNRIANPKGVQVIDAPITGGASGAQNKTLCYMVGGDAELVAKCEPVFKTSASKIIHAGPLTSGMKLKLCNNLMTYAEFIAVYEAMRLARASGLDPKVLKEVGAANGNITQQMSMFLMLHEMKPHMSEADFASFSKGFAAVAQKDLSVALAVAESVGEKLPGCEKSLSLIEAVYTDTYN